MSSGYNVKLHIESLYSIQVKDFHDNKGGNVATHH